MVVAITGIYFMYKGYTKVMLRFSEFGESSRGASNGSASHVGTSKLQVPWTPLGCTPVSHILFRECVQPSRTSFIGKPGTI